jgi:hypothetical protein
VTDAREQTNILTKTMGGRVTEMIEMRPVVTASPLHLPQRWAALAGTSDGDGRVIVMTRLTEKNNGLA